MIIGRIIGVILLLAAAGVLAHDMFDWSTKGFLAPIVAGQLWFDLAPSSLNLVQAVIQRYIAAWLWDPVISTILLWWAWVVLAVPGAVLLLASTLPSRRRRRPGETRMQ